MIKNYLFFFEKARVIDTIRAKKIMRIYLDRAKSKSDTLKIAKGYGKLAFICKSSEKLNFIDSIINLTKTINDKDYPALAYIYKGDYYLFRHEYKLANISFTKAYKFSIKSKNIVYQVHVSNQLIALETYWGDNNNTLKLQKKRHQLLLDDAYLIELKKSIKNSKRSLEDLYNGEMLGSMINFVACYLNLEQLDSASIYIKKGKELNLKSIGIAKEYYHNYLTYATINLQYKSENYKNVIVASNELLKTIDVNKKYNYDMFVDLIFFKGFSLIKLDKYNEGIKNLKKADSLFANNDLVSVLPYHRVLFKELQTYHSLKNDDKMKLKYTKRLEKVDSIFKENYQFYESNLIRNYEVPLLLKEKEENVTTNLKKKHLLKTWWLSAFLILSLIIFSYYFKKQQLYKRRFKNLMEENDILKSKNIKTIPKNISNKNKLNDINISLEIIKNILNQLDDFEFKKEYLSPDISLHGMAKSFGTNYKYLSKIINQKKEKSFVRYINDLRIEYAFAELKSNPKLQKYTVTAIANECGFNSSRHFSKFFHEKYGIYPSYYIKHLNIH